VADGIMGERKLLLSLSLLSLWWGAGGAQIILKLWESPIGLQCVSTFFFFGNFGTIKTSEMSGRVGTLDTCKLKKSTLFHPSMHTLVIGSLGILPTLNRHGTFKSVALISKHIY
jgi:hypothetical protein